MDEKKVLAIAWPRCEIFYKIERWETSDYESCAVASMSNK